MPSTNRNEDNLKELARDKVKRRLSLHVQKSKMEDVIEEDVEW